MRVSILASGSSGNLTLLETERTRLLIDAGLGKRETLARLAAVERTVEHIDGILITHEHTDHCNGLPQMLGLWKAPLYVTEPTMDAMKRILPETFGKRLKRVEAVQPGQRFTVGDIEVHAFSIPHDAADPIGFTFQRVLSRTGHLSNHAVSEYLSDPDGFDAVARYLVLAHVSQENNNPDLVRLSAEEALKRRPAESAFTGELLVASQHVPLKPLEL